MLVKTGKIVDAYRDMCYYGLYVLLEMHIQERIACLDAVAHVESLDDPILCYAATVRLLMA
jgi:hypothetical protein